MAKNNKGIAGLVTGLSTPKIEGLNLSKSLKPGSLSGSYSSNSGNVSKPPSSGEVRTSSLSGKTTATPINFGRPSNSRTATTKSSSMLTSLIKQTASGGIASALTGGLSSIAGLGGLFTGIASLFGGGKSAPPPLVDFQLPNSISQTISVSSRGSAAYQRTPAEQPSALGTTGGQAVKAQQLQYQSAAIAQAVKTAILSSSSLNDVIAEI